MSPTIIADTAGAILRLGASYGIDLLAGKRHAMSRDMRFEAAWSATP